MPKDSKGKGIDRSSAWSDWEWDDRGFYYASRYDSSGQIEYSYQPPQATQTSQQEANPRTPGDHVISSSDPIALDTSSGAGGSYGTLEYRSSKRTEGTSGVASSISEHQPVATYAPHDSYYTTTAATEHQDSSSKTSQIIHSTETGASSSPSSVGSFISSGPSTIYQRSDSTPFSHGYDLDAGILSATRGLSLSNVPSTIREEDYGESSNTPASYQNQALSNYIKRPANSSDKEKLDPRYRCISEKEQRKFWKVGRVFMMLWTEPAAVSASTRNGTHYSTVWLEQGAYSEIRRFVVIKEGHGNSICSPIHTYNGQATLKPNLPERQQHAIIYTSKECPPEHSYTATDGTVVKENLSKDPIKVRREQSGSEGDLGYFSRLNYSKIYTVENYVRVLKIGMVERECLPTLVANSYIRPSETPVERPLRYPSNEPSDTRERERKPRGKGKESSRKSRH